jgi:hypothetical protein
VALTYEEILGRQPASTSGGDRVAARTFVDFLSVQLAGGVGHLNDSQRHYLLKLRSKWQERADGRDTRWNEYGSRPGRPHAKAKPRRGHYKREEDADPLLASILRKFGTPRNREDV